MSLTPESDVGEGGRGVSQVVLLMFAGLAQNSLLAGPGWGSRSDLAVFQVPLILQQLAKTFSLVAGCGERKRSSPVMEALLNLLLASSLAKVWHPTGQSKSHE